MVSGHDASKEPCWRIARDVYRKFSVAVKERKLSYHSPETKFTRCVYIYTHNMVILH